jgi:hypothetical protein
MSPFFTALKKTATAWRLPFREKVWFLLFYPYSGLVRAAILMLPFSLLSRSYGRYYSNTQCSPLVSEQQQMLAWRIGKVAELAARYTPWESKCLVQAIMVRTLLGFYGIPYVMHLGARMTGDEKEPMKAHAWIKVGPWIISGREGHRAYGVVSSFVSPSIFNQKTLS